ncbi:hypothetical protein scyTo_0019883 [Scyliorhinus torazame]|uniref:Uncharacterized protein n=1 Tax=Scyliorhinus torazame TaxID=75743 RepID=A0A401PTE2_SCYTO|nr:hypothetical protein [Scyliorhinus torazame]
MEKNPLTGSIQELTIKSDPRASEEQCYEVEPDGSSGDASGDGSGQYIPQEQGGIKPQIQHITPSPVIDDYLLSEPVKEPPTEASVTEGIEGFSGQRESVLQDVIISGTSGKMPLQEVDIGVKATTGSPGQSGAEDDHSLPGPKGEIGSGSEDLYSEKGTKVNY